MPVAPTQRSPTIINKSRATEDWGTKTEPNIKPKPMSKNQ